MRAGFGAALLGGALLGWSIARPASDAGIVVKAKGLSWTHDVMALALLPSESTVIEARAAGGDRLQLACEGGAAEELARGRWRYTAPPERGVDVVSIEGPRTAVTLNVFVMVPLSEVRDGHIGTFEVGHYPPEPHRGLGEYLPPRGFVEVTPGSGDVRIAPHFVLRQLLGRQAGGFPKYVVLDERLILALEKILARVRQLGHPADTLTIMSGYRTPHYNARIGQGPNSRHVFGDAADIYVDAAPPEGRIDDLDGDGEVGLGDAERLFDIIDALPLGPGAPRFPGGLGLYGRTASHPEFVHVDMRSGAPRWRDASSRRDEAPSGDGRGANSPRALCSARRAP